MGGGPSGKRGGYSQAGDCVAQSGEGVSAICPRTPGALGSWVDS